MGVSAIRPSVHLAQRQVPRAWRILLVLSAALSWGGPARAAAFGLDDVAALARDLAAKPYKAPADRLPHDLDPVGAVGEHTGDILEELELDPETVAEMRESGAI